jgi:hypothetical protein
MSAATIIALGGWAVGTGVLAFSVMAKLTHWSATTAAWPLTGPRLRRVVSPAVATGAEIGVLVLAMVPIAAQLRLAVMGLLYGVYACAAVGLRGRSCGCFGTRLRTRFTAGHAVACAAVAGLCLVGVAQPAPARSMASVVAMAATAIGLVAGLPWWSRLGRNQKRDSPPIRGELIARIEVYGTDACPVCTTLWDQQAYYRSFASCPVVFRKVTSAQEPAIVDGGVPAAVGYNAQGELLHGPVHGLPAIRDLLAATATTAAVVDVV